MTGVHYSQHPISNLIYNCVLMTQNDPFASARLSHSCIFQEQYAFNVVVNLLTM